jgi:hypothetical protein
MFHEGTGGNRWSLGLSFACKAEQWPSLPESWVTGAITQGATEARAMADWVQETTGIVVPAERITKAQYNAGRPGFISHAELDPGRRSDPGTRFPWGRFLTSYADANPVSLPKGHTMIQLTPEWELNLKEIQEILKEYSGYEGPIDAKPGPGTMEAFGRLKAMAINPSPTAAVKLGTTGRHPDTVHIVSQFRWGHLPLRLQEVSRPSAVLVSAMLAALPDGPELTAGLRKVLEGKDCFVRATAD